MKFFDAKGFCCCLFYIWLFKYSERQGKPSGLKKSFLKVSYWQNCLMCQSFSRGSCKAHIQGYCTLKPGPWRFYIEVYGIVQSKSIYYISLFYLLIFSKKKVWKISFIFWCELLKLVFYVFFFYILIEWYSEIISF